MNTVCSLSFFRKSVLEYTVDINPSTEAPVKSVLYHNVPDFTELSYDIKVRNSTRDLLSNNWKRMKKLYSYKYSARFDIGFLEESTEREKLKKMLIFPYF